MRFLQQQPLSLQTGVGLGEPPEGWGKGLPFHGGASSRAGGADGGAEPPRTSSESAGLSEAARRAGDFSL